MTPKPTIKNGHVINCCGQQIHEDSKIYLSENDRREFGRARFVDALAFIRKYPQKHIGGAFIIGTLSYEGHGNLLTEADKAAFKYNVPDVYEMNGWIVGGPKAA